VSEDEMLSLAFAVWVAVGAIALGYARSRRGK